MDQQGLIPPSVPVPSRSVILASCAFRLLYTLSISKSARGCHCGYHIPGHAASPVPALVLRVRLPAPPLAPRASWQLCTEPPAPFPSSPSPEALVPARYRRCLGWALQLGLAQPLPRAWCLQWSYSWSCSCKGRLLARALGWRGLWGTAPVFVCLQNMFWMRNDSSGSECRLTFAMLEEGCQHCIDAACGPLPGGN